MIIRFRGCKCRRQCLRFVQNKVFINYVSFTMSVMSRSDLEYVRRWATSKLISCGDQAQSPFLVLRNSLDEMLAKRDCDSARDCNDANINAQSFRADPRTC